MVGRGTTAASATLLFLINPIDKVLRDTDLAIRVGELGVCTGIAGSIGFVIAALLARRNKGSPLGSIAFAVAALIFAALHMLAVFGLAFARAISSGLHGGF